MPENKFTKFGESGYSPEIDAMTRDLASKAMNDAEMAVDRVMNIVPDDDRNIEGFIKISILASMATRFMSNHIDFMYAVNTKGGDIEDLTLAQYKEVMANEMIRIGRILVEGQRLRRERRKPTR